MSQAQNIAKTIAATTAKIAALQTKVADLNDKANAVQVNIDSITETMMKYSSINDFESARDEQIKLNAERSKKNRLIGDAAVKGMELEQLENDLKAAQVEHVAQLVHQYGLDLDALKTNSVFAQMLTKPKKVETEDGEKKTSSLSGRTVAPKYRNTPTGETWSGRGLKPRWMVAALAGGASIEEFKI
jgi:DNA-binding protein H-NS